MLHKYLHRRGNIYYFRWRIPADLRPVLGVIELVHSLRTADQLQAGVRAGRFALAVAGIQRARQAYLALELDTDEYVSSVKQYWVCVCSMTQKTIKTGLITFGDFTFDYDGDVDKELAAVAKAKEMGLLPQAEELKQSDDDTATGPLFSEVFTDFLAHKTNVKEAQKKGKKPLSEQRQKEHARYFDSLIAVLGDSPISSISKKSLKDAILACRCLPRRNLKKYKGVPVLELLEMDIPDEHCITDKTTLEIKKTAQGIFSYAVEKTFIDVSPAVGMKLDLNTKGSFAPYSDDEVRIMLSASFEEREPWRQWMLMLAAYTGARRGELAQLRMEDVKFDSVSRRHYILITEDAGSVKTENAIRQIPLHDKLLNKGFIGFAQTANDRLFGDLDPQAVTKWFTAFRDRLGIERFDDFGKRKVFHSFRHTFVTKSRGAEGNSLDHVQQVVGHEKTSAGVTDRYSHPQPLKVVLGVVDKVEYG